MRPHRILPLLLALATLTAPVRRPAAQEAAAWLEPTRAEPAGTKYRTFPSKTIGAEASYLVYLPPGYAAEPARRYPVVYWLHGLGGDQRTGGAFAQHLDTAIRAGRVPPAIAVLVNGLRASMYCDSRDGKTPVESVIIRDLVPHVDSAWRTQARREARAIEGFSMGGWGAARLGFKYPQLFGVVSILGGALHNAGSFTARRGEIFRTVFGEDREYFQASSPWTLAERNADAIRGRTRVRVWVGEEDMLLDRNREYHEHLRRLRIAHDFRTLPGVGHNYRQLYEKAGDNGLAFYQEAFRE